MNHKSRRHFVRSLALATIFAFLFQWTGAPMANAYVRDFTVPAAGGCPQPQHQNIAIGAVPLARQWSTSLPNTNPAAIVTTAAQGTPAQLNEIEATIQQAYAIWVGVSGTLVNANSFPNALGTLGRTATQNACSPDPVNGVQTGVDGINTICFNQTSAAFTTGVLSFTRIMVADAPSQVFGSAPPSIFAGQIVDADISMARTRWDLCLSVTVILFTPSRSSASSSPPTWPAPLRARAAQARRLRAQCPRSTQTSPRASGRSHTP